MMSFNMALKIAFVVGFKRTVLALDIDAIPMHNLMNLKYT